MLSRFTRELLIESQKLDGTQRKKIRTMKSIDCSGIAYDWMGNNIYIATTLKIEVISMNSMVVPKTLVETIHTG